MKPSFYEDFAIALDPVLFAQAAGIDPDDWQQALLFSTEKQIILNCCRQSGKSTIVALLSLHHALNVAQALVLVLSPSLRQSSELYKKIILFYKALGHTLPTAVQTALTLEFKNGSRIISLPSTEQTVRGFNSASLIVIDEAARVSDDLYFAVRPMLAVSGGKIILLSTPHGKQGFFFQAWENEDDWLKIRVLWQECPRLSKEEIDRERKSFPPWFFRQEYKCSFEEGNQSIINPESIRKAFINDLPADDYDFMNPEWDNDVGIQLLRD